MARRRRRRRVRTTHSSLAASDPFDPRSYGGRGGSGIPWGWIGLGLAAFMLVNRRSGAISGFEEEIEAQGIAGWM